MFPVTVELSEALVEYATTVGWVDEASVTFAEWTFVPAVCVASLKLTMHFKSWGMPVLLVLSVHVPDDILHVQVPT